MTISPTTALATLREIASVTASVCLPSTERRRCLCALTQCDGNSRHRRWSVAPRASSPFRNVSLNSSRSRVRRRPRRASHTPSPVRARPDDHRTRRRVSLVHELFSRPRRTRRRRHRSIAPTPRRTPTGFRFIIDASPRAHTATASGPARRRRGPRRTTTTDTPLS